MIALASVVLPVVLPVLQASELVPWQQAGYRKQWVGTRFVGEQPGQEQQLETIHSYSVYTQRKHCTYQLVHIVLYSSGH